jgi:hypothetical protein
MSRAELPSVVKFDPFEDVAETALLNNQMGANLPERILNFG